MRFIDYDKVIVIPIELCQIMTVGEALFSAKVGVIENIKVNTVFIEQIGSYIISILVPIVCKFFGCEYKDVFVS
mgnify:CR=1 FL=1